MSSSDRQGEMPGWAVLQLGQVFGALGRLAEPGGGARLLDRLVDTFDADVAVWHSDGADEFVGVRHDDRAALSALLSALAATGWSAASAAGPFTATGEQSRIDGQFLLVVPLKGRAQEFVVVARRSEPFTLEERLLGQAVGQAVDLALASQRAIQELTGQTELLSILRDVERSISLQASVRETLRGIVDGTQRLFAGTLSGVLLVDGDRLRTAAGSAEGAYPAEAALFEVDDHVRALLAQPGVVEIPDYAAEPEPQAAVLAFGIRRLLTASIQDGGVPIGLIVVCDEHVGRPFAPEQVESLRMLADHAALAIGNVRAREAEAASRAVIEERSITDDLTGVLNRRGLFGWIDDRLRSTDDGPTWTALFIDLDRFKAINDVHGHAAGDQILVEVARRLREVASDEVVGRLAGDEFVVVVRGTIDDAQVLATQVALALERPIECSGVGIDVSASIGVAELSDHRSATALLSRADLAMMEAKRRGRRRTVHYGPALEAELSRRKQLASSIREVLATGQPVVGLQPILEPTTGRLVGMETLLRWPDGAGGNIPPPEVFTAATDAGLVSQLDLAILGVALDHLVELRRSTGDDEMWVSVNLTPATVTRPDLGDRILRELGRRGLPPWALVIELIESSVLDDEMPLESLVHLEQRGVLVAIDDFGTGWSSLQRLRRVPVHVLKIDRIFVAGIGSEPADEAIIQVLLQLAPALGLEVIAEGVETEEQLEWLGRQGCTYVQGYHVGRPVPPEEFTRIWGPVLAGHVPPLRRGA